MRSQEADTRKGLSSVSGLVNADGSVQSGVGYVVTKTGTGIYKITLPGFRVLKDVSVSLTAGGFILFSWSQPSNQFTVSTYSTTTAAQDQGFSFTAEGFK